MLRGKSGRKNAYRRRLPILLLVLLLIPALAGCGSKTDTTGETEVQKAEDTVFRFLGQDISLGEVYLYAKPVIEDYDKTYGSEIWAMNVRLDENKNQDMVTLTRRDVIENIVKVKLLLKKAPDYGVSLSDEDKTTIETETESFWKNLTDEQIDQMKLERQMVHTCIEENLMAKRVYEVMMSQAGIEVSDEVARETTFFDLYFPTYTEKSDGVLMPMSGEEKQEQYDKAVQAYNTLINPAEDNVKKDPSLLASYYNLKDATYYTMTPNEILTTYGKDVYDMLYTLEDGSCSLVTETEYGYHVFYMKALTDRDATDKRKARLEREQRNEYFTRIYEGWLKEEDPNYHYEDSVDFEIYDRIPFQ